MNDSAAVTYAPRRSAQLAFVDAARPAPSPARLGQTSAVDRDAAAARDAARLDGRGGVVPVRRRRARASDAPRASRLDWRGFGAERHAATADTYWFPDYLGDLDALLDHCRPPSAPVDLLGHSMGGNVAMLYAGVRPERVRRLVNLEGFGMPRSSPAQAPKRIAQWLDELKAPQDAAPLREPRRRRRRGCARPTRCCARDRAAWLAAHWSRRPATTASAQHPRRSGAQARRAGALSPGRRVARVLEADHRAGALGRGRPQRHRALVGRPLHQGASSTSG